MADWVFSIKGNNEEFIKGAEQIRSSIRSITVELENANNENRGFTEVLKKTFDAIKTEELLI